MSGDGLNARASANATEPPGGAATSASSAPIEVVKLGGAAIDAGSAHPEIWRTLAERHAAARSRGGGLVVVHGGGAAVDRHLARIGASVQRVRGLRVTPPEQIDDIVAVLAGLVNQRLVTLLRQAAAPACGLSMADGGLGQLAWLDGSDAAATPAGAAATLGHVGCVVGGDPQLVRDLHDGGWLPVVSCVGISDEGAFLNVNADDAAAGLVAVLGARRLTLLTDVAGVLDPDGATIASLDQAGIESRIADGTIHGGMVPKVRAAIATATRLGVPVHIASWAAPDDGAFPGTVIEPAAGAAGAATGASSGAVSGGTSVASGASRAVEVRA